MKLENLYNYRKCDYESKDDFCKYIFRVSKRVCPSLMINASETQVIISAVAKFYKIEIQEVIQLIREIEFYNPSNTYRLQYVNCLGKFYLNIEKR